MSGIVLQTKLYIPAVWAKLVHRPRLINRLDQGQQLGHKLALISAPAGFGKSTLVSEWITAGKRPAGWLSLDEGDNDPARFLTYLIAALRTINPSIGEGVLGSQQASQTPANESILTVLLNEITAIPDKFVLVLDDYHVIDSQAANGSISEDTLTDVDGILTFLLEHLPPQMQLVIATREDPRLPLARLRGRGQLTELRAADLRFTPGEAAIFLNQVMGLGLSGTEVAALETRTEGWIAGLQLAALSMQGREDIPGFIRAFTGDNHYIVDYLVEEVLQRQPERVGSFLLQTSILDRLSGPLCDAVTGQEDGKEMLETLERGNLFVVPLDDKRQWYRYHHLFADVLQARLMEEQPNQLPILHRRASGWYEGNGFPAEAVSHAFTVEDFERAADLVELTWRLMDRRFQSATWLGWAKALPEEQVRARPVLSAGYAWALLDNGELEASEGRLRDAERWLDLMAERDGGSEALPAGMIVANEEEFRSLQVTIANGRAFQAQALDDVPGTLKYTRQALDLLPEDAYFERGIQAAILGLAYWGSGELEAAHRSIADGVDYMWLADNMLFALSGTSTLADIRIAQGRLGEAISTYEQSLQLAMAQGEPMIQGLADLYLGLSELHCERGDLRAARQNLLRSEELGEKAALPRWPYRRQLAWAQIKQAEGDLDGALEMLREAERLYTRHAIPDVRPVAALKTRVWIKQGRSVEALDWVRERKLSVDDELSYLSEFEHITLARVLIGRYKTERLDGAIQEAWGLLERLLEAAEEGERVGSVIEILVLQALAHQVQGETAHALGCLERALTLAEPESYVQIFVEEGPSMAALLREMAKKRDAPKYARQIGAALGEVEGMSPDAQLLSEPLSERELEVLRLLGSELNGPEIATELMVSLNTMRTHTKNIYNKLEVNNRRAAVRRAEELELL